MSPRIEDRLITSLTNDTVKSVRALHMRKERETTGRFLAEGLKFIGEALDQGRIPRLLLVGMEAREHPILERAKAETRAAGGEVVVVTHPILEKISRRDNPQTVLGVFDQVYTPLSAIQPHRLRPGWRWSRCAIPAIWAPSFARLTPLDAAASS